MATSSHRLEEFLVRPSEDLAVEYKSWLILDDKADAAALAQALLALANHGGGHVVIGFKENGGRLVPDGPHPSSLAAFTQDAVNGIVQSYAEPVFHCAMAHVAHPESGLSFPVITVPDTLRVPVRARRDGPERQHVKEHAYYIRRPGPKSETPRTGQEWDVLIGRCVRASREALLADLQALLAGEHSPAPAASVRDTLGAWAEASERRFRELVSERLATETPSRFAHGTWSVAYVIENAPPVAGLAQLKDLIVNVKGHETGWPPWWVPTRQGIAPYVADGLIECWLGEPGKDVGHSDFWRVAPDGRLFLLRGYQEDGSDGGGIAPGSVLDVTLPLWRVGECLLHASRTAEAFGVPEREVTFRFRWSGLKGRSLTTVTRKWEYPWDFEGHVSQQDEVSVLYTSRADLIGAALDTAVAQITKPLYETFAFFEVDQRIVKHELEKMRGRRR